MLITAADFSRLKKVSKPAVHKAMSNGRLFDAVIEQDGRKWLQQEKAFALWDRTVKPTTEDKNISVKPKEKEGEEIPSFNESRAKREAMMARLAEIDVEEREKLLVPSEEVKNAWIQLVTIAKTKVLGIPTKAKQRIPDLDKGAMALLDEIVRETLEDLAVENVEAA